jgi:hypothetical protein
VKKLPFKGKKLIIVVKKLPFKGKKLVIAPVEIAI